MNPDINIFVAGKDDIYQHLWESMFKKCFNYGNAKFETPVPITSLQLRNLGHGYWLAREWVTIQVWSTVDAVVKNTVKSQERRNGASNKNSWGTIFFFFYTWGESYDGLCIC